MGQDWIKLEKSTFAKPEIAAMARALKKDPDLIFAKCVRVWSHFDTHTLNGFLALASGKWLDALVSLRGFAIAMQDVGWLKIAEEGLYLPNFDRHNGETAKQRSLKARRMEKSRTGQKQSETTERDSRTQPPSRDRDNSGASCATNVAHDAPQVEKKTGASGGASCATFVAHDAPPDKIRLDEKEEIQSPLPPLENLPGSPSALELAEKAAFLRGEGASSTEIRRWTVHLTDLLIAGVSSQAIEAELDRHARMRSEPAWDFQKRMLKEYGVDRKAIQPDRYAGFRAAIAVDLSHEAGSYGEPEAPH